MYVHVQTEDAADDESEHVLSTDYPRMEASDH